MIRLRSCERICVSLQREHNNLCDGSGEQNQTIASSPFRGLYYFFIWPYFTVFFVTKTPPRPPSFSGQPKCCRVPFTSRFIDMKMVLCVILLFLGDIGGGLTQKAPVATSRLAGLSG